MPSNVISLKNLHIKGRSPEVIVRPHRGHCDWSDDTPKLMGQRRSYAWRREGLATPLRLLQRAVPLESSPSSRPKLGDQYRLLRSAAAEIEIDNNLPLSRFLCPYAPALLEFITLVVAAPPRQFKHTRPHGIF